MSARIVIVGAGVAGATAAKTLRREGYTGQIVLLRPGTWVDRIEPDRSRVRLADGTPLEYGRLLLATGARARTLAGQHPAVRTMRSIADADTLRALLFDGGSLLVVGAGLIGCEVAATARGLGVAVTVVHAASSPLERVAPAVLGEHMHRLHTGHGVAIHNEVTLDRLDHTDSAVTAIATDGRRWTASAVLVAIGSVPDTGLAEAAGVAVDNGIRVDEHYRTSIPGIYAAGDVANRYVPDIGGFERSEHWNSARAQGVAAARAMLDTAPAEPEVSFGWSTQYGVNLQFAGRIGADDELVVRGADTETPAVLALRAGRLVGAAGIDCPGDLRIARRLIADRAHLDPRLCAQGPLESAVRDQGTVRVR
ncbi:FAD-dependent oxidoreductase [Nocardia cyriacigeorgica]|uniref:NAD(P)/FAD-dependent oxidoreductase n=1 Tax=Nocardia cyriacigeorgica TaxID=135487 RepID=UPI00189615EA|nr:FAD-dependent oxidoreductase [Nocardia cyriacigeorgica]MBF6098574.1 FAD-dependent oxidoreductase [Nocardia cyriacigeorgica]MBF6160732.1 FAD-dependent oxidoreductase [Nocardia cyriacigeorgica]MBF6199501.1 FAD-dependent oxidoreductase [Nocardia cyriacigeorgica]MBF6514594.1 FAD-dependent oxidoreductase [Nocardia cyriacigeorgica]